MKAKFTFKGLAIDGKSHLIARCGEWLGAAKKILEN